MPYDIYPGVDDDLNFPPAIRAALAASSEFKDLFDAITKSRQAYNYRWANAAARNAQTGMRVFDRGIQLDTGREYQYYSTNWKVQHKTGVAFSIAEINSMSVPTGTETLCDDGATYKLIVAPGATTATWRKWNSPWVDFSNPGVNGIVAGGIYTSPARYCYDNGRINYEGEINLNSITGINGNLQVALPTNADTSFNPTLDADVTYVNSSDNRRRYKGSVFYAGTVVLEFVTINGDSIKNTFPFGEPWSQSDSIYWNVRYDVP